MYTPPQFKVEDIGEAHALMRARPFATLVTNGSEGLFATHLPTVLETDGADMQNRDHEVYFSAAHAAKDSGIALSLAKDVDLRLPLAQATYDQYERMKELELGELDKSGVSELTFKSRHGQTPAHVNAVGGK